MNSNWSDYERFLKPVHLKGAAMTLTIVKATEEETHPQKGKSVLSPVLWFRELPFGLILSPTNRQTLIDLYGDDVIACLGQPITVQAVKVKVAGNDKQPIRILKQRPAAPKINVTTGEMVPAEGEGPVTPPVTKERGESEGGSELDAFLGPSPEPLSPTWPVTRVEFLAWLKDKSINGQETRRAFGTDAESWLRMNPGRTYADVAQAIAAVSRKG